LLLFVQDVCMPELNGIQLLSCVKQDASLRAVPVVSECGPGAAPVIQLAVESGRELGGWQLSRCWVP
jgi:PleD family two-component response regulator